MIIAADYPLGEIILTMVVFFGWVIWIWTLVMVLSDVFGRSDLSGWAKAGWTALVVFFPFLGVLVYLIAHGSEMGERRFRATERAMAQGRERYGASAPTNGAAEQIAEAKKLRDSGAIDDAEFAELKRKVLA
jgi:Phospholipase_D-nuclease N-terminal/Short C-terminal domain